jgi:hypothetical protein
MLWMFFTNTFVGGLYITPRGWLLSVLIIWTTSKHRTRDNLVHSLLSRFQTSLTILTTLWTVDEFYIYYWADRVEKSRCFDFGDFLTARDIANNLGTDVGIIPCFWDNIRMRDHDDNNGIWAETIRIMRSKISDEAW